MDRNLRLRLHVRRNGLPENNVLFNVPLDSNPTIANLLELVNDTVPLEDADGEWGLDDYVVEVRDKDPHGRGNAFECLHFQPLAGLLDKDDEVFIRPLLTVDLKKRRLSGRDQILPGGEHIIDGVPFGRPRLRAPRGRPPVAIAPRKRRRLLNDQEYGLDHVDDTPDEDFAEDEFSGSVRPGAAGRLLLTRHGEDASRATRQVRFGSGPGPDSDEASDEISDVEEGSDHDGDEDIAEPDAQELADEAAYLRRELTEEEGDRPRTRTRLRSEVEASKRPKRFNGSNVDNFGPLEVDRDANPAPPVEDSSSNLALFDKVVAVRAAFNVSHGDAMKLLRKHDMDVSKVWRALERSLKPRQGLAETMVLATQLELPRELQIISSPSRSPVEALGDISRIDDDDQADSSSSDEEDASDDSDEILVDAKDHGRGATESDSDEDSDSPSEYVSARPSPPQHDTVDESSSTSEDSSSDSDKENEAVKSTKTQARPATLPQAQDDESSDSSDTSDSSSEEEAPVPPRTKGRHAHTIVSSDESSSSSSDASSDSSSDSSSESESEEATNLLAVQSQLSRDTAPQRKKGPAGSHHTTPQQNILVPPGQGLTKTQRRNQRRRLQMQFKKAELQSSSVSTQDVTNKETDLEAKKEELLQTLLTGSKTVHKGPARAIDDVQMADEDPNAWNHKISYRAVECVQESVELSEPPFPFVQRWDPQQRWDSQPSQRRGKRKSRADSQFYNEANSHNTKKRRFGRRVEEYSYQEDTTTLLANQEDIKLDYDDATFNPDKDPMANGFIGQASRPDDEQDSDDLPPLPEDMSSLPVLQVIDLKLGMIIAWKQLMCTEATQWQPQLSDYVTASVTETREGSANFQVQLARRDRNIDRNEKRYDEETGQRIYGKFEAPDSDEDGEEDAPEEEDDGIREVFFSEMIEPRIVQDAAEISGADNSSEDSTVNDSSKSKGSDFAAPQLPEVGVEVADSQPKSKSHDKENSGRRSESQDQSGTLENDHGTNQQSGRSPASNIDVDVTVEESLIPETIHDQANSPARDVSITEDRRGEINKLSNEGGFRPEVRLSIDKSAFLQFGQGSPSRQLEEEYASSVLLSNHGDTSRSNSSSGAPSEYGFKEPMQNEKPHVPHSDSNSDQPPKIATPHGFKCPLQQIMSQAAADVEAEMFHSAPQTPNHRQMPSDRLNDEDSTRLTTPGGHHSAGKVEYPKLNASQTTQASELSGRRQLDPNFITHSDDLGVSLPGDSPIMDGFHDEDAPLGGDSTEPDRPERERTSMQQVYIDGSQIASVSITPFKSTQLDAQPSSPPKSATSQRSDSSFPDIKFVSSQVARLKFKELPNIKSERRSSEDVLANDNLPPQPPRLSPQAEAPSPSQAMKWNPSPAAHSTPGKKNENHGINGGHARSNSVSFQESISPPALSRPRQTRASSRSQDTSRDKASAPGPPIRLDKASDIGPDNSGTKTKTKERGFIIPKGSQVVDLLTSSPEPEPEPEPEYSEMYADDSVDDDYLGSLPRTRKAGASKRTRRASLPVAERRREETMTTGWVGGSQGPSRKASGRFGGRFSSAGGFY